MKRAIKTATWAWCWAGEVGLWCRAAVRELLPRERPTVENLHPGETANLRAFLATHDLLQVPAGGMVTAWVGDE